MQTVAGCVGVALCVAGFMPNAVHASPHDLSSDVRRATGCMLEVLKTTPGATHAKLGMSYQRGWRHPFLEYRALENGKWATTAHFDLLKPRDSGNRPVFFGFGLLPGIHTRGTMRNTHVTSVIVQKWQAQCDVAVVATSG